jgi:HEAT repeat protein
MMAAKKHKRAQEKRVLLCAFLCLFAATMGWSVSYDALIFDAQRYGNTPEKREAKRIAREELFARGPDALREVMQRVHYENVMMGVLAQEMVEQMEPAEAAPVLAEFLDSPHARTRRIAVFFMGFHNTPEYASRIMPLLDDEEVAGAALRTLGKWKAKEAVPLIVPFLANEREVRRIAAVNALRDIGDPTVVPLLKPLLEDSFFTVREATKRALGVLRPD